MAKRTRDELIAALAAGFPTDPGSASRIRSAELRAYVTDLLDSLAFVDALGVDQAARQAAAEAKGEADMAAKAAAENRVRLEAIPSYAAQLTVFPPNVRQHSDFQRKFQSTLSALDPALATNGGSTGTRFVNTFKILTRLANDSVVQLHTQGWAFTEDDRQTIPWEVDAAEFNSVGASASTNGVEVWGEFRAVYGGGVDEFRGRTNPVFIDFGEEGEWPATRGDIPEQRVLQNVSVPSAETRGKVVTFDDGRTYVTRPERDVTTPATAVFENYSAVDYVGAFGDDDEPTAADNIGKWYWHRTRTTAFRSFRDNGGAEWRAADVNRLIIGGEYRGSWLSDMFATPHITQRGDYYSDAGGNLRVATAFTAEQHTHVRDQLDRIVTESDVLYAAAALQWDVNPSVLPARTAAAIATEYTVELDFPLPNLTGSFYRIVIGNDATELRRWVHGQTKLPTVTLDAGQAASVLANIPEGQDHIEIILQFFANASVLSAHVGATSRRIEFAAAAPQQVQAAIEAALPPFADIRLLPEAVPGVQIPDSFYLELAGKLTSREINGLTLLIAGQTIQPHVSTPVAGFDTETQALVRFDVSAVANAIANSISSADRTLQVDLTFSFTEGDDFTRRILLPVKNPNAPRLVQGELDSIPFNAALTLDWEVSDMRTVTLTDDVTFAFSNILVGRPLVLEVKQGGAGGHDITWPASVEWAGGGAEGPSSGAGDVDIFTLLPLSSTRVLAVALLDVS